MLINLTHMCLLLFENSTSNRRASRAALCHRLRRSHRRMALIARRAAPPNRSAYHRALRRPRRRTARVRVRQSRRWQPPDGSVDPGTVGRSAAQRDAWDCRCHSARAKQFSSTLHFRPLLNQNEIFGCETQWSHYVRHIIILSALSHRPQSFRREWGDDYFAFWVGGVKCIALNTSLYHTPDDAQASQGSQRNRFIALSVILAFGS
jgi:hypothetical protein